MFLTAKFVDSPIAYFNLNVFFLALLFIGLVLLIVPQIPARFKEWGYVGFGILYITAFIGHLAVGDAMVPYGMMCLIFFGLLLTSYITYHKLNNTTIS